MTIEEYFGDWTKIIDLNQVQSLMGKLLHSKQPICPLSKDVFRAFNLCPLHNLRVIILAQDPYNNYKNNVPVATGIAFANSANTKENEYSPSLTVLRESVIDYTIPHRHIIFDPSLENWEEQGVLLLNTSLSCVLGKSNSHSLMWRPFIKSLLINLSLSVTGIVYVLIGNEAQSFEPYINHKFNIVYKTKHPAWYMRNHMSMPSDIWHSINNFLIAHNGYGIQWYMEHDV